MTRDQGSALFEVVILGFLVTLLVLQAVVATGRVHAAGEEAAEVAQAAAAWAARYGEAGDADSMARRLLPDAAVVVSSDGRSIEVQVRITVSVVGPETGPVRVAVTGRATAPISDYRSRHG